jgi:hypothetical protein
MVSSPELRMRVIVLGCRGERDLLSKQCLTHMDLTSGNMCSGVGKSVLVERFVGGRFQPSIIPTSGIETHTRIILLKG